MTRGSTARLRLRLAKVEFNERFEREARAVSALNHPHICQLYDVGPNYLVMEFVEGSPLKGPMPSSRVLALAIQLAGAMDAAHRKGITHRDLKPANVLVTKSGVKVLDFGIAKMARARGVGVSEDTFTQSPTQEGPSSGPCNIWLRSSCRLEEVDGRADIFSFGCVLYEMLTGKRAFDGQNAASIIAAVMERPAPIGGGSGSGGAGSRGEAMSGEGSRRPLAVGSGSESGVGLDRRRRG